MATAEPEIITEVHDLGLSADEYARLLDAMEYVNATATASGPARGPFAMPAAA